jgi:hypothetical protein
MIDRAVIGKLNFAGKSLQEITNELIKAGYKVTRELQGSKLLITVSQRIELDLGVLPEDLNNDE